MVNQSYNNTEQELFEYSDYCEYFEQYLAPYAIECGQSAYEFWHGDPSFTWQYIKAYENKVRRKAEYDDAICYKNAFYNLLAIAQSMSKKTIFPQKPFGIPNKEQPKHVSIEESNNAWYAFLQKKLS